MALLEEALKASEPWLRNKAKAASALLAASIPAGLLALIPEPFRTPTLISTSIVLLALSTILARQLVMASDRTKRLSDELSSLREKPRTTPPSQRDILSFLYANYGTSYTKKALMGHLQFSEADISLYLGTLVHKGFVTPPKKRFWDGTGPKPDGYHITNEGAAEAIR